MKEEKHVCKFSEQAGTLFLLSASETGSCTLCMFKFNCSYNTAVYIYLVLILAMCSHILFFLYVVILCETSIIMLVIYYDYACARGIYWLFVTQVCGGVV